MWGVFYLNSGIPVRRHHRFQQKNRLVNIIPEIINQPGLAVSHCFWYEFIYQFINLTSPRCLGIPRIFCKWTVSPQKNHWGDPPVLECHQKKSKRVYGWSTVCRFSDTFSGKTWKNAWQNLRVSILFTSTDRDKTLVHQKQSIPWAELDCMDSMARPCRWRLPKLGVDWLCIYFCIEISHYIHIKLIFPLIFH